MKAEAAKSAPGHRLWLSDDPGDSIGAKRLLPGLIAVPPALAAVVSAGLQAQYFSVPFAIGLLALATTLLLLGLALWAARQQQHLHDRHRRLIDALDKLVETWPGGMVVVEASGKIVRVNRQLEEDFGYRREELLGGPIETLVPTDLEGNAIQPRLQFNHASVARRMEAGRVLWGQRKDGSRFPIEVGLSPYQDDDHPYMLATVVDITARKSAEQALAASEERLRFALQTSQIGVWDTDPGKQSEYRSVEYDRLFGYHERQSQWTWDSFLDHVIPADRARVVEQCQAAFATQSRWDFECRIKRRDGEIHWIWTVGQHFPRSGNRRARFISIAQDITERKSKDAQVRLWAEAFRRSNLSLAISDAKQNRYIAVNPAFARARGYKTEELQGQPILMIAPAEHKGAYQEMLTELDTLSHGVYERVHLCKDGRSFPVLLDITVLRDANGQPDQRVVYALDISDRKRAEARLRDSERRWRELANSLPQLVWSCTAEGYCDFLSRQWVGFTGVSEAEQLGRGWLTRVHPDDRAGLMAAWQTAVERQEAFQHAFRIRRYDGCYRYFDARAVPLRGDAGIVVKWYGSNMDVTAQVEAEAALRESEERLRNANEAADVGTWHVDLRTLLDTRDATLNRILGLEAVQTVQPAADFLQRVHPLDRPLANKAFKSSIAGGTSYDIELRIQRPDGSIRWLRDRGRTVCDADGTPLYATGAAVDISERKFAEQALRDSEARMRLMVEHAPVAIALFDREMRYLAASRRWMDDYGIAGPLEALLGRSHYEVLPEIKPAWREAHQRGLQGEILRAEQDRFERPDGTVQYIRWELYPWTDAAGAVRGIVIFAEDVTGRVAAEVELQRRTTALQAANTELLRSNAELDAFAYVASHDLKEPLRGIHNNAQFLLEDYAEKLDQDGIDKLHVLQRLTQRMRDLIDALLSYSQIGRRSIERIPVNLNEVLESVLEIIEPRLQAAQVSVRVPRPLPSVRADPTLLVEVYTNLMTNAIKYNDKPEKWIELGFCEGADPSPVLYVRDNGIGIRPQHIPTIFTIFKRLHGRDAFGGGTGAGLTIVKKIVERQGGRIWVESEWQHGSTFYFTLAAEHAV